jgi:hypothetical protein
MEAIWYYHTAYIIVNIIQFAGVIGYDRGNCSVGTISGITVAVIKSL